MSSYKRIKAVKIGNEILKFFSDQTGPVSAAEIAKALSLPTSTVLCHLATHEDSGFVEKVGEGYAPGPAIAAIWAGYRSRLKKKIDVFGEVFRALGVKE